MLLKEAAMKAVIYTSNTGFTRKYAQMLSEQLSLPAYNAGLGEDKKLLSKGDGVIYMGWINAGRIEGLKKARRRYSVRAVCPCGISEADDNVIRNLRAKNGIADDIPVFYLRGGMDFSRLTGGQKKMLMMFGRVLKKTAGSGKDREEAKKATEIIKILDKGADFTGRMKLKPVIEWYREYKY